MNTSRRTLLRIGIGAGIAVVALVVIGLVARNFVGLQLGREMEELNGQTHTTHYDSARKAPAHDLPSWFPGSATGVTIEVPGPHAKSAGGIQVDATIPTSYELPASCTPTGRSFPWAGGFDGLNINSAHLELCAGWTATLSGSQLYVWKSFGPNT